MSRATALGRCARRRRSSSCTSQEQWHTRKLECDAALVQEKTDRSKFTAMRSSTAEFDGRDGQSKLPIFSFRVDGWAEMVYTRRGGVGTR